LILENIDYDVLANDPHVDREQLDEIVDLMQETACSTRSRIRVAGNDYAAESALQATIIQPGSCGQSC